MNNETDREKIIRDLYGELTRNVLPNSINDNKNYYFEEGTGTWYMLTGKSKIDRPNIETAKRYFEDILKPISHCTYGQPEYQKALYCAIAIEGIQRMLDSKKGK